MAGSTPRRTALSAAGLPPAALVSLLAGFSALPATAATSAAGNVVDDYVRLRTHADGRPAWWLSRGTRYLLADFQLTPLHAMNMASAVVADRKDDGSFVVRTLEGSYSTDLESAELIDGFVNPSTGARVPLASSPPVVVTYQYHSDGRMTYPVGAPPRPGTEMRGALAHRAAFGGAVSIEERFSVRTQTATTTSNLGEQIVFRAGSEGSTKTVVVMRNWPYGQEQSFLLLAVYEGRRFDSFEAFMDEIGAARLDTAQPGFRQRLADYR